MTSISMATVLPGIEADNARAQAIFLASYPALTEEDVADLAGQGVRDGFAMVDRWKQEQRIFAVRVNGCNIYPAFQFAGGQPRPALQAALKALSARSGWSTAFWLIAPNGWLGGVAPIARLDDADALETAAAHEGALWVG